MKVIFLENVINVWKKWEIKEVKSWYASNFLLPRKYAIEFTKEEEKKYNNKLKQQDNKRRELVENKQEIIDKLNKQNLFFKLEAWTWEKVYWWVWEKDIINQIKSKYKIVLSKKHIELPLWHIKKIWESDIFINLWTKYIAKMIVQIERR